MKRRSRVVVALSTLGAIPGLIPSSLPGSAVLNASGSRIVGGLLMLAGSTVFAVAWWHDATEPDSTVGDAGR